MLWFVAGCLIPSFFISFLVSFLVRKRAARFGLIDRPGLHKGHATPTPTGGGLAIWAGIVVPLAAGQLALWMLTEPQGYSRAGGVVSDGFFWGWVAPHIPGLWQQAPRLWMLLAAGTALLILGLIDDMRRLGWRLRLAVQVLIAGFIVWQGWRLTAFFDFPPLTFALSVIWIVGLINAFNMLDNMDGLSAGVAAIVAGGLAAVIFTAPNPITEGPQIFVGGFLLVLCGSLLGFLWHNRAPARLFMGDAGSYFIGFCLATVSISAGGIEGEGIPRPALFTLLCVFAVPIYDAVTVIWIRLREGHSPFQGDQNHISHRLVRLGLTKSQAVYVIYAGSAVGGSAALLLHNVDVSKAVLIMIAFAMFLLGIARLDLVARRRVQARLQKAA